MGQACYELGMKALQQMYEAIPCLSATPNSICWPRPPANYELFSDLILGKHIPDHLIARHFAQCISIYLGFLKIVP